MKFYGIEVADGSEIQNLVVERVTTLPTGLDSTDRGRLVFHSGELKVWNGSAWVILAIEVPAVVFVNSFRAPNTPTHRTGDVLLGAADLVGLINETNLPAASTTVRGGIQVGSGLTITSGDVLNVATTAVIPAGTTMAFYEKTAPVGWTPVTLGNTYCIRMVNAGGTGGTGGGSDDPIVNNSIVSHTHTYSGTTGNYDINHTHQVGMNVGSVYNPPTTAGIQVGQAAKAEIRGWTNGMDSNNNHTHTFSGTTTGPGGGSVVGTWTPRYLDFILCTKT